jgi:hypothetical protein
MAGESHQHPPEHYLRIISYLNRDGIIPEIVAGQAVNIWASLYADWDSRHSPLEPKLTSFQPYVSGDLELMTSVSASLERAQGFVSAERRDPFGKVWAPDRVTIYLDDAEHGRLKIQVMNALVGLSLEEIATRMLTLELQPGAKVKVLDPIALLKAKAGNLVEIDQTGRQDFRHLQMLIRCVRAFVGVRLQEGVAFRDILKLINRVADFSRTSNAQHVGHELGISWEDCLPLDIIKVKAATESDAALTRFISEFLPRWLSTLAENPKLKP